LICPFEQHVGDDDNDDDDDDDKRDHETTHMDFVMTQIF
jgi:hypothetical protein